MDTNTNNNNSIHDVIDGTAIQFLVSEDDSIIFDMNVETSLYNTFPPGMQYYVLNINNNDDGNNISQV